MHSGYITVDKDMGNHYFFWYFRSLQTADAPLLVWLGDQPGHSSMQGLFWQLGPFKLNSDLRSYILRDDSPLGRFSIVYVDNPVGTGYSYSDSSHQGYLNATHNQKGLSKEVGEFLHQFTQIFPEYQKDNDVYIGGQSSAARIALQLAGQIRRGEIAADAKINLKGLVLGNPLLWNSRAGHGSLSFSLDMTTSKGKLENYYLALFLGKDYPPTELPQPFDNIAIAEAFNPWAIKWVMELTTTRDLLNYVENIDFRAVNEDVANGPSFFPKSWNDLSALGKNVTDNYKVLVYNGNFNQLITTKAVDSQVNAVFGDWKVIKEPLATPDAPDQPRTPDASDRPRTPTTEEVMRLPWIYNRRLAGFYASNGNMCRVIVHGEGHRIGRRFPQTFTAMMEQFLSYGCVRPNSS